MRRDNVLTGTLLCNAKLSSLIFLADIRELCSASRCTTQGWQGSFAGVSWWFLLDGYFVAADFSHTLHISLNLVDADTCLVRGSLCGVSSLVER